MFTFKNTRAWRILKSFLHFKLLLLAASSLTTQLFALDELANWLKLMCIHIKKMYTQFFITPFFLLLNIFYLAATILTSNFCVCGLARVHVFRARMRIRAHRACIYACMRMQLALALYRSVHVLRSYA